MKIQGVNTSKCFKQYLEYGNYHISVQLLLLLFTITIVSPTLPVHLLLPEVISEVEADPSLTY